MTAIHYVMLLALALCLAGTLLECFLCGYRTRHKNIAGLLKDENIRLALSNAKLKKEVVDLQVALEDQSDQFTRHNRAIIGRFIHAVGKFDQDAAKSMAAEIAALETASVLGRAMSGK